MGTQLKILWSIAGRLLLIKGLDKLKIVEEYGEKMVEEWRRSYTIAPPKVFPEDPRHPVNDKRYK